MKHEFPKTHPLSAEYTRPKPFISDLVKLHEDDGTGLYDPAEITILSDNGSEDERRQVKLNNFQVFVASANSIPGASARLSSSSEDLPMEVIKQNTAEYREAKREGRPPELIYGVIISGATKEQLDRAILDLYDTADSSNNAPVARL